MFGCAESSDNRCSPLHRVLPVLRDEDKLRRMKSEESVEILNLYSNYTLLVVVSNRAVLSPKAFEGYV